ncbi:phage terminase large subunit [Sediminivirga luteola]|nr:phage terminase large subunit [Sediminivirga luteola]
MAVALDHRTNQTGLMRLFDEALVWAFNTPDARLMISCPPQSGKSQRVSRRFPLWVLTQRPDTRVTIASYETGVARRWGRAVRDDIRMHQDVLDINIRQDVSAQSEWTLEGHEGGVFTAGIGSALTGRPSELMIIDDPHKNRDEADSPIYQERAWEWWSSTALTRLAPGAPVVITATRWSSADLLGKILANDPAGKWRVINVPAQADHRPELGETDPLGREPGEWLTTTRGMTPEQWEERKRETSPRDWAALYQGRPSPEEGGVFPAEWARYSQPMWIEHDNGVRTVPGLHRLDTELAQSWDLTFSDTKGSDYVVGQVWLRVGVKVYLLDQVRARMNFTATCEAMKAMRARWPEAVQTFVENRANGPAVMNALAQQINGLIPVEPEGSKMARASAVSPFAFSGDIVLPTSDLLPSVGEFLEEAKGFGAGGAHDDMIDAMSQCVNLLLLNPLTEDASGQAEEFDEIDELGWSIFPH